MIAGTLTYNVTPAKAEQMLGRPVGPNHLNEFFIATDYDPIVPGVVEKFDGTVVREVVDGCRLHFELLTKEKRDEVSEEHRLDFVKHTDKILRDFPQVVPEWSNKVWKMTGLQIIQAQRVSRL